MVLDWLMPLFYAFIILSVLSSKILTHKSLITDY